MMRRIFGKIIIGIGIILLAVIAIYIILSLFSRPELNIFNVGFAVLAVMLPLSIIQIGWDFGEFAFGKPPETYDEFYEYGKKLFEKAQDKYDDDGFPNKGYMKRALKDFNKSFTLAQSANDEKIELASKFYIASTNYSLQNHKTAISIFDELIETEPNDPDYKEGRGLAYMYIGNIEQALIDLNAALELVPIDQVDNRNRIQNHLKLANENRAGFIGRLLGSKGTAPQVGRIRVESDQVRWKDCDSCQGRGWHDRERICNVCGGNGKVVA